jgi:probable F420-dependent oxidoreductase
VKLWFDIGLFPTRWLPQLAVRAEEVGLEGVAFADHMCVPRQIDSMYPYGKDGSPAAGDIPIDTEFPDPLVAIAALAATTTRLRFATHVLLAPLRHPVLLAKQVGTASVLCDGRLELGVGVGWMREEYDAVAVPFEHRGAMLNEALPLLRELWTGNNVDHEGRFYRLDGVCVRPTPPQHVPLIVGGESDAALRRAAKFGDGWTSVTPSIERLEALLTKLARYRIEYGTYERPFEIRSGVWGRVSVEAISQMEELGVTSFCVMPYQVLPRGSSIYDMTAANVVEELHRFVSGLSEGLATLGS